MSYEYEGAMGLDSIVGIGGRVTGCPASRPTGNIISSPGPMPDEQQQRLETWFRSRGCVPHPSGTPGAFCCSGEHRPPASVYMATLGGSEIPRWVPFVVVGVFGLVIVIALVAPAVSGATGAYMTAPEGRKKEALWKGALVGLGSSMAAGAALSGTGFEGLAGAAPFAAGAYIGSEMEEEERA